MKITCAIPILTFVGFLNSECAASDDFMLVQMWDNHWFYGKVYHDRPVPDWMSPRKNPKNFQGYEVHVRLLNHHQYLYRSDLLIPMWPVPPNRNAAAHLPRKIILWLGYDNYGKKEPFVLYNPAIKPLWNCDRLFITIPGTTLVYQTVLEIDENVTPAPSSPRDTKRPRLE